MWFSFRPYVSVSQRRAQAAQAIAKRRKKGDVVSPVVIEGRTIAKSFWGRAWCDHLESYSDYSNRLPRGRTYVRNGSVVDLKIEAGKVVALVSGSSLYKVDITIDPLKKSCWHGVKSRCSGQIGSLVELLQGRLSNEVMSVVTARDDGLFPQPREIKLKCSCPDWATMCKHVAAVLYGVGARLDRQPELLFKLRDVDHLELIAQAAVPLKTEKGGKGKVLAADQLADVFGIELAPGESETPAKVSIDPKVKTRVSRRGSKQKKAASTAGPKKPR